MHWPVHEKIIIIIIIIIIKLVPIPHSWSYMNETSTQTCIWNMNDTSTTWVRHVHSTIEWSVEFHAQFQLWLENKFPPLHFHWTRKDGPDLPFSMEASCMHFLIPPPPLSFAFYCCLSLYRIEITPTFICLSLLSFLISDWDLRYCTWCNTCK